MDEKEQQIKKLEKEIEMSEKEIETSYKKLVFLGDKGLGDRTKPFKTESEFFKAFREECLKVDDAKAKKSYRAFEQCLMNTGVHLETAAFIVEIELKEVFDSYEELNKITRLSFELIKAFKWCAKMLTEYVSYSNEKFKPMILMPYNKEHTETTKLIHDTEKEFIQMLEKIRPVFSYLNSKVKSSYKELTELGIEVEKKGKIIHKTNKELKSFKSSNEKHSEIADIYIKVLRNANRKPTVKALEIATDGRISSATWSRKLRHTSVLDAILEKLLKLMANDQRLKDQSRKKFYEDVYKDLNITYSDTLTKKLTNESKKHSQNIKDNYDKIAYNEYDNEDN